MNASPRRRLSPEDLTLTLAQEFRGARTWFAQHKRDPFLWLVILGPPTLAAITPWWGVYVFPPSDAIRAISEARPNAEMALPNFRFPTKFPKCGEQTYIFGYYFSSETDFGRACRDIVNGGWVVDILFRGRAGAALGGKAAHQRRGEKDCREYCEAAGFVTSAVGLRNG